MDVATAIELAFWILGPVGMMALMCRLGRNADGGPALLPNPNVKPIEPGWTEAMSTDGTLHYGRAYSVNRALIDRDAMARIRESYIPAEG